jgi:hypothetical protein
MQMNDPSKLLLAFAKIAKILETKSIEECIEECPITAICIGNVLNSHPEWFALVNTDPHTWSYIKDKLQGNVTECLENIQGIINELPGTSVCEKDIVDMALSNDFKVGNLTHPESLFILGYCLEEIFNNADEHAEC